jgi:2,3-bisphosphoglycerate-independent phosphoglycerate mutase
VKNLQSVTLNKKVALIIMDGWGKETDKSRSAIAMAKTPNVDSYYKKHSNSELVTFGEDVGLPEGQMGNSEVGHMNLGAGRIVYQELMRVNNAIKDNSLKNNKILQNTFNYAKKESKQLHLFGLLSDGGVHSHINHIEAIARYAHEAGVEKIFIHAFMDGRDCDPRSGLGFVKQACNNLADTRAKIASVIGRYYAMDRDKRWERVKKAWDLLVMGKGHKFTSAIDAVESSYQKGITDEFIEPSVISDENGNPLSTIQPGDAVISVNFRTDRCREITQVLTQFNMPDFDMHTLHLHYVTMTRYDDTFSNVEVIFEKDNLNNTLGEILEREGKTQLRVAETEKYPHVTFFFSGGRENPFHQEHRVLISSPKVATYDLQPEMSAWQVKDATIKAIDEHTPDFICLNFANTDMVGHTGVFEAGMKAAEVVDTCVNEVINKALEKNYDILLTADHGNADIMINEDGSPNTAHTKNMVPLFYISNESKASIKNGKLGDIAPTILHIMGIEIPAEMTGEILLHE